MTLKIKFFLTAILIAQFSLAQITPVENGDEYSLSVGDVQFVVDASFGARITSFKLGEKEFLLPGKNMTGSTLWTSPQGDWNWPPLKTTDSEQYNATIDGDKMIFESEEENGLSGKKFKFIKSFWANESDQSISIRYTLENTGTQSMSNALWAVTRVEPEGLTFWKAGDKAPWFNGNWTATLLDAIEEDAGFYWLEFDIANGNSNKFFSGIGESGWFAHVNSDNVVFIKSFSDITASDYAPGEGEFEYYTGGTYIELENQSSYVDIAAGESFHYDVTWHLRQLPDDVSAEIGSAPLIDFVQKVVDGETPVGFDVLKNSVSLFPNPVSNVLNVDISKALAGAARFNLFDLSGRLIQNTQVDQNTQLDVSHLAKGVYMYSIVSDQKTVKGKLIKQ